MSRLSRDELDAVVEVINSPLQISIGSVSCSYYASVCDDLWMLGSVKLSKAYGRFWDQDSDSVWKLSSDPFERSNERAMLLATFYVLKGIIP